LHELAGLLLEAVGLLGHPSYEAPVVKLASSMLGWEQSSLPLKRVGTGLERLLLAVVDNCVPSELVHSVHPGFLEIGDSPEPVGQWVERLCCSAAIVRKLGFRSAHNPDHVELGLDRLYSVLHPGERVSKRLKTHRNYAEDEEEAFPPLGTNALRPEGSEGFRVVALTASNDPLGDREPMVESECMSMDELDDCLHGVGEESICLGNPGLSVCEWTMSMTLTKDDTGKGKMRAMCELASEHVERCDSEALGALGGFRLHRRIPADTGLDLAVAVEFEGWSGWLMLEWLVRKHSDPLCNMLKLSNVVHRGRLASFLELTLKRVTVPALAQILDKCSIYLVGPLFRDLGKKTSQFS